MMRRRTLAGHRIAPRLRRFRRDRGGGIIIVFALALVPLIASVSLGVEFLRKVNYRSRLDAALDSAVIAAITTARDYISANPNNLPDPTASSIPIATQRAYAVFRANAASVLTAVPTTPVITLSRTGQTLTASGTYATSFASPFGRLLGSPTLAIAGSAASSLTLGVYADFYLLLDTSGSMGFPTSSDQQASFAKLNPDMNWDQVGNNCAFACHYPSFSGYALSKANNIELRIKTVGNAVVQLLDTAKQRATLNDQFRVGLYPFVSRMETAADSTTALDSLRPIARNLENYMDIGDSSVPRGSGGTHYDNVFPSIGAKITRIGDGSTSARAKPFVFLITDGMANTQYYTGTASTYNPEGWTGSYSNLLDPSYCTTIKNRNVTISVLYIPYIPLQTPFNTNVGDENTRVNSLIPDVPKNLQACASPGYFYTASSADQITAALAAMFNQAVAIARLTR